MVCHKQFTNSALWKAHLANKCGGKAQVDIHTTKPFKNNADIVKSMDTSKVKKDDIFADADKVMDISNDGIKAKEIITEPVETEPVETKEIITEPVIEATAAIIEEVSNAKIIEKQKAPKSKGTTRKISPRSKMKQK